MLKCKTCHRFLLRHSTSRSRITVHPNDGTFSGIVKYLLTKYPKKRVFMALTDTHAAAGDVGLGRLLGKAVLIGVQNDEVCMDDYRQKVMSLYLEYDGYLQECGLTDDQVELLTRLHEEFRELTVPKYLLSHLVKQRLLGN